jgi:hypothetical protein
MNAMTRPPDPDRQTRGVKLMLVILGAIVMVFGWFQWGNLVGLFQ